ncbi:MAG: hypothetical protein RR060_07235, partial [Victivallaceae bacterium]
NMGGNCNVKLDNTMELFGSDVALMFVNDELIIGERHGNGEDLRRWRLKVEDPASHQKYTLLVAGAENDALILESSEVSGTILISRSDADTLVFDVDINIQGREVNGAVAVKS